MKRIIALVVLILFCLSSCSVKEPKKHKEYKEDLFSYIKINIKEKRSWIKDGFEIEVELYKKADYSMVFYINSSCFVVILPDGTEVEKYECVYRETEEDFHSYQTFKLRYVDKKKNRLGCISFCLLGPLDSGDQKEGHKIKLYYRVVFGMYIKLSENEMKNPDIFDPQKRHPNRYG